MSEHESFSLVVRIAAGTTYEKGRNGMDPKIVRSSSCLSRECRAKEPSNGYTAVANVTKLSLDILNELS